MSHAPPETGFRVTAALPLTSATLGIAPTQANAADDDVSLEITVFPPVDSRHAAPNDSGIAPRAQYR